jgi:hypothetical protein
MYIYTYIDVSFLIFSSQTDNHKGSRDTQREWLCRYLMDPTSGGCEGRNTSEVATSEAHKEALLWITEAELGGPRFFNDKEHAAIAKDDLPTRPHELPSLAARNVKQYGLTQHIIEKIKSQTDTSAIEVKAKLGADQYTAVKSDMDGVFNRDEERPTKVHKGARTGSTHAGSSNKSATASTRLSTSSEVSEAEKATKKMKSEAVKCHNKYKLLLDEINGEISTKEIIKTRMEARGLPATMKDYVDKELIPIEELVATHRVKVVALFDRLSEVTTDKTGDAFEKIKEDVGSEFFVLQKAWAAFEKLHWNNFKSMS